jgi:rhodanese-related sulfurtransferase
MGNAAFQRLTPTQAVTWLAAHPDALVLDARDARSHHAGCLIGPTGPAIRLDGRNHEDLLQRESRRRPVFVYCYHGNASQTYAQMFADFGFATVADLIGGHQAWQQATVAAAPAPALAAPPEDLQTWVAAAGFADPHTPGAHGNTPLMHAAWRGDEARVQDLLALGADPAATNGDGNTALWLACVADQPALVQRLAQAGAAIDHANLTGATCLMYAASSSKPAIVRTLLDLGADPHLRTQDDYTALDMAASLECLQLLRHATRAPRAAA